jgi:CBS domain-containing protein
MSVAQILREKGNNIISVEESASVSEVLAVLKEHRIGAVLVMDQGKVCGVLSERDVVRALPDKGAALLDEPVHVLMTRDVVYCDSNDSLESLMARMTENRIRHLPVQDNGKLAGIVTIGDVVKYRIAETEHEAEALRSYITLS